MITMRKMTDTEFLRFKEYSVTDYAADLVRGERLDKEQALKKAEAEFSGMLPDGPDTADQFLMMLQDAKTGEEVGWIWFFYEENEKGIKQVFLSDFLIYEYERRKGYAAAALHEMEQKAKADGRTEVILYVWEHNVPGFNLYQKCGYTAVQQSESGTAMKKML